MKVGDNIIVDRGAGFYAEAVIKRFSEKNDSEQVEVELAEAESAWLSIESIIPVEE